MSSIKVNGLSGPNDLPNYGFLTNGDGVVLDDKSIEDASLAELEAELPMVYDGQVEMRELLSRMMQAIYAELTEMAETLPGMSDSARKRTIADWVVKTKKQVVKLYAVVRWARDAGEVQKAMNITAFLLCQNQQFLDAINAITAVKEGLAPARLRNHDILTSLDVLTSGTYLRLPSQIKKFFITPPQLSDEDVQKTLSIMEEHIRYRLRMKEVIPIEMSRLRIEDGRAFFTVPDFFETSIGLRGAQIDDPWFFIHVEFLHGVSGDVSEVQEFPRNPPDALKRHIAEEADGRLSYYSPIPHDPYAPPSYEPPPRPQLPPNTSDSPLIRLFNFLQMMSMTYQLEILFFQAQRLRSLGWRDFLSLERNRDGKSFTASYWIRQPNTGNHRQVQQRFQIPPFGGTLSISLEQVFGPTKVGGGPQRTSKARTLTILENRRKLGSTLPADEVETFNFVVKWEPAKGALGVTLPLELEVIDPRELIIDPQKLNFEALLRRVIKKHIHSILAMYERFLLNGPASPMFSYAGEVLLIREDGFDFLKVHMCADEYLTISFDIRTGRLSLKDTGGLSASEKSRYYVSLSDFITENPFKIIECIVKSRFRSIIESADQKAQYMGLQTFREKNLLPEERKKFGNDVQDSLFIQLANFPVYYLVLVVTTTEFRFALVCTRIKPDHPTRALLLDDIGWLDGSRIHIENSMSRDMSRNGSALAGPLKGFGPFDLTLGLDRFKLETETLRELYAFCCARVAYTKVELQLKAQAIPYSYLSPTLEPNADLPYMQSSLVRSVPGLCVQSSKILERAPAAEAAMPNVRFIPLNWWSNRKSQVVTCVKLKQVQQPIGKHAGTASVIRLSKRIIYDTQEAIVSFLSENVDNCVNEFLEEWAKVSKMVVIAREVTQMSKLRSWSDVQLLSFDLQKVEFAYCQDYTVSITCTEQISATETKSSFELVFNRLKKARSSFLEAPPNASGEDELDNPHAEGQDYLKRILRHGPQLPASLQQLVGILRDTLPLACVIETLREKADVGEDSLARKVGVDAFPKGAGWYRITYGDSRHALDLRSLTSRRVTIMDASLPTSNPVMTLRGRFRPLPKSKGKNPKTSSSLNKEVTEGVATASHVGVLLPIRNFAALILDVISDTIKVECETVATDGPWSREHAQATLRKSGIVPVECGIVCNVEMVSRLVPAIHERVLETITETGSKAG